MNVDEKAIRLIKEQIEIFNNKLMNCNDKKLKKILIDELHFFEEQLKKHCS